MICPAPFRPRALVFALATTALIAASGSALAAQRIQVSDFSKIVTVADPQFSPDGKSIVCVITRRDMVADKNDRELLLIDVASGAQRQLTYDRKAVSMPRWSPTGDRIAFLAAPEPPKDAKEKEDKTQIYVLPFAGGEAQKITDSPTPIEQFAWRPVGKDIAFVAADEPANKKDIENHLDAFEVGDNDFLQTKAPTPSHLWLIASEGGKSRRLTSGSWSLPKVLPPSSPSAPICWSPNGKLLCFTRQDDPHSGHSDERTVQVLNVETGAIKKLTGNPRFESYGVFSPDGQKLAYWYSRDGDSSNQNEIMVTSLTGGASQDLTRDLDRNCYRDIWLPDGKTLLIGGHDGTRTSLWLKPLNGPARKLDLGDINPAWSFWVDVAVGPHGELAIDGSTPDRPSEIYLMTSPTEKPRRLTNFNEEIASRALGRTESIEWDGPDGQKEDGVLVYPPGFEHGRKYPLVLVIHGGPRAASGIDFNFQAQTLAAHDYVIFQPNYRGSDNLGNAYTHGVWNDAGEGPGRDVMAGLAKVKSMGFVDESRIAVSGWSYGGYMTSWLIGHEHFWRCAVAGAPVTNWFDQYNIGDGNVTVGFRLNGSPFKGDNAANYRAQSPITYANTINTPTLVMCDVGDWRVPIPQAYELYHAIKDQGVEVKFVAYPVPGHFPNDPVRAQDVYARWNGWIDEHMKKSEPMRAGKTSTPITTASTGNPQH